MSSSGAKAGATVLAEDKTTGLVLRADVILDKIHSLKVRGGGGSSVQLYRQDPNDFFSDMDPT